MAKKGDNLSKTLHLHPNHAGEHPLEMGVILAST
jgi:hypothetical protein